METTPQPTPPRRPAAPPLVEDGDRAGRIQRAVYDFLARRERGEDLEAELFQADHPDLMPELADAVAAGLRSYRRVFDADRAWGDQGHADPPPTTTDSAGPCGVAIRGYRLRREISSGGQGTVFEAVHGPTGRVVAVKVITGVSRNSAARFEREARALATLSHPGLVGILDRGLTQGGAYYLSVEYVAGHDLDDWVRTCRKDGRGVRDVVRLFVKVADALEAAHAKGIVHRDIKPSNVRVDALDNPRLIDFGLAHVVAGDAAGIGADARRLTLTRDVVGSLHWLSPEQAAGDVRAIAPASDVYSLGVVMYHSLTGRFPYPVDGPIHEVTRHICQTPPAPPTAAADRGFVPIDQSLAGVLLRCLAKAPEDRYPSAGALAADLEAYLGGMLAAVETPLDPPRRRFRLLIAVSIAVAIVGISLLAYETQDAGSEPLPVVKLPHFTNSVGMDFVEIPMGQFNMGSARDEVGRLDDEQWHPVQLTRPIAVGRTEVTRTQYLKVMGTLPSGVPAEPGDVPVDFVTWEEATAFCQKLGESDGQHYRLPTEAEWEYACIAGIKGPYGGIQREHLGDVAWFAPNSGGTLHPVAMKEPNRWGLYDMHGNASEFTADYYTRYLGQAPRVDPSFLHGLSCVVRGGTVNSQAEDCRSARRTSMLHDRPYHDVGFRVIVDRDDRRAPNLAPATFSAQ